MRWISIKDRLPSEIECAQNHGWFLVCHQGMQTAEKSRYDGADSNYKHGWKYVWDESVTHWMPLPPTPYSGGN